MVISHIKRFFQEHKRRLQEKRKEKDSAESFRETEEMKKAEEIKREADRLAQLKQFRTAIEEYAKALEFYPYKGNEENIFKNAADFVFKCNYNVAACYSYMDNFDKAIEFFDKALQIDMAETETKVKALMGKGTCFYRKKQLLEGRYKQGAYHISMEAEWEVSDEQVEEYKKEDKKKDFLRQAYGCFSAATELDSSNVEAWYMKGHMEVLMGKIKDAVRSFDNVLNINKDHENKESIPLFDEIKREKGISIKTSEILERSMYAEPAFKTKTGHMVKTRAEMMIANMLFDNSLIFQYNTVATWADKDDFKPSFYIPKLDLYIDHYPYDYVKEYQKIVRANVKQYDKHKKKHVYITSEDEKNLEESLKLKLKPYIVL